MNQVLQQHLQEFKEKNKNHAHLLISCPDQPGIVAAVSNFLYEQGANILNSNQYTTDPQGGTFFIRFDFSCEDLSAREGELEQRFEEIANKFQMNWQIIYAYHLKKMAIFVSKEDHALLELLWQCQSGDIITDIALVISNHEDVRHTVESLDIPFYYTPITKETKREVEEQQLQLLKEYNVDVIVLARYMQILTPEFVSNFPNQIINIHHSFLPAFIGAKPYERAFDRGVKLIGATSHYVTNDLDEGPIIEQDVERVNHKDDVDELKRIGRMIERRVLARAVKWHLEDRVIVHGNKTIVFE
ncbi:formyltetrahydrofolate deformylase [Bacillus sp. Marseille-P3661]|uniref:formyltetrahydrofolate deformylase n=1 Tax=Bacillus sp. Marseille-P3661 TaxID=1936234 RepID=UPI000C831CF4|nr:formyltetrahydrofolate deformylase [Bacillus sp. Marseille-P3661]